MNGPVCPGESPLTEIKKRIRDPVTWPRAGPHPLALPQRWEGLLPLGQSLLADVRIQWHDLYLGLDGRSFDQSESIQR